MIKYKSGYKYQLAEDMSFILPIQPGQVPDGENYFRCGSFLSLRSNGLLTINAGYSWDGCSGPTWDDKSNMRGGLKHDAIYQFIRNGVLPEDPFREMADKILRDTMYEDMMSSKPKWKPMWMHEAWAKSRSNYYYFAVRKFGGAAVKKPRDVLEAP